MAVFEYATRGFAGEIASRLVTMTICSERMLGDGTPSAMQKVASADTAQSSVGLSDPDQWVDLHGNYLFRYALIRVRNSTVAEDLVQETLLAALQAKDRYVDQSSERGWLTGILRHKILDHFRRLSREQAVVHDESLPEELEGKFDDLGLWKREPSLGPGEWSEDAASMMQGREFMVALKQCLSKLPQRCADAFVLREMEAVESGKIQELLGVTPANLWVLLHRARMQLRLCLEKNWIKL